MNTRTRLIVIPALAAAGVMTIAACGSSSSESSTSSSPSTTTANASAPFGPGCSAVPTSGPGSVAEMASLPVEHINLLPRPLATVIFHYSPTMDYRPEFTSMVEPNSDEAQVRALREIYGAEPKALSDVILLVPADKIDERREEYPGIAVHPLKFAACELQTNHWRFLMGAVGNQATYIRQLNRVMKSLRTDLTLAGLRQGIDSARLPDHLKDMARMRLDLAAGTRDIQRTRDRHEPILE